MQFTAEMIAGVLQGDVVGNPQAAVHTFAKIEEGHEGALSFLANPKYEQYLYTTASSIVIVNRSFEPSQPVPTTMIKVDDAYGCFAKLLEFYVANKPRKKGISERASIDSTAQLGEGCYVGDFAVIDSGVKMGANCRIYPHVYIGDNVR
ncbi:MAG: UDP-3-O-(3-hydroxymyristoyl)glucosamine N-acyltransferase, partial [Rikenellaceae bacterium]|nr:UDP-3-O-(3-hydroxymyristoyl)glucosamine N-acyltransferase [Rikenellaceae bacterium]